MRLRTRLAVVLSSLILLLGLGAGVQANAASAPKANVPTTANNGCVVIPSLELAACLARF